MFKKLFYGVTILFSVLSISLYAQTLRVNNQEVEEGETINLFFEDLFVGKIVFSLRADNLKKAEITFDKGKTWQEMTREKEYFIFEYRPLVEEEILPEFILTEESGSLRTYKPYVKIVYQKKKPDDAVLLVLDKMKLFYEEENIDRFMDLFSFNYPDRIKFKEAIQNDFYNYKNIRLRYRVDRKTFDSDYKGAIWDVYWERKYDDREGNSYSDSASIAMRLEKEGANWLITGLRGNTIFGSTLLAKADLEPISLTSDNLIPPTLSAVIRNNGSTTAYNIPVKIYSNSVLFYSTTISSLAPGTQTTISHQGYYSGYGSSPIGKVVVDEDNIIAETNENNNEYSAQLP